MPKKSETIHFLLVDDQEEIIFGIQEIILSEFRSTITIAMCGRDAIKILKRGNIFDLIICDLQMPEGDGKEVFNYVQSLPDPTPFILHTSSLELPEFSGRNFLGTITKFDSEKMNKLIRSQS